MACRTGKGIIDIQLEKRIAILGSTGSIGRSALEVVEHLGPPYRVVALSAHRNHARLLEQARRFRPAVVGVTDGEVSPQAAAEFAALGCEVLQGQESLCRIASRDDVDIVLAAVVGAASLPAVIAAVEKGKRLALASKESLVVAGSLLIPLARRTGAEILPVDSEHSAVFQAMQCGTGEQVRRVVLTASGGPFREASVQEMEQATVADALNHPTWRMGGKITIDSATMFNKALEVIEACWLFSLPPEKVEVVIHPESIVHSMVEFVDGSVIAQLSPPDMRTPIQYALTYPDRAVGIAPRLDLATAFRLTFEPPDPRRFPALRLAFEVARTGGVSGAVLNAANEVAVEAFRDGRISFGDIARIVERTIRLHHLQPRPGLADLLEADRRARQLARTMVEERQSQPAVT